MSWFEKYWKDLQAAGYYTGAWLKRIWRRYHHGAAANYFPIFVPHRDIALCGLFGGKLRHISNFDEALYALDRTLDEVVRNDIFSFNQSEMDVVTKSHHTLGRWIRNNWGLWDTSSSLHRWFKKRGIWHADDMSCIIIRSYYRKFKGEPIRFQEQVQSFIEFWKAEAEGRGVIMGGTGI